MTIPSSTFTNTLLDTEALYGTLGQDTTYVPSLPNLICFSLVTDSCDAIDYDLLRPKDIYLFGQLLFA